MTPNNALFSVEITQTGQFIEAEVGPIQVVIQRQDDGVSVYFYNQAGETISESWVTFGEAELNEEVA